MSVAAAAAAAAAAGGRNAQKDARPKMSRLQASPRLRCIRPRRRAALRAQEISSDHTLQAQLFDKAFKQRLGPSVDKLGHLKATSRATSIGGTARDLAN